MDTDKQSALLLTEKQWADLASVLRLALDQCWGLVHDERVLIAKILDAA